MGLAIPRPAMRKGEEPARLHSHPGEAPTMKPPFKRAAEHTREEWRALSTKQREAITREEQRRDPSLRAAQTAVRKRFQ